MKKTKARIWLSSATVLAVVFSVAPLQVTAKPKAQTARVEITSKGYQPGNFRLRRGVLARVTFVRTTDATCVKEIVLPDFNIRRALPLNQPVVITFKPTTKGTFTFVCGMKMMSGQLIVQ